MISMNSRAATVIDEAAVHFFTREAYNEPISMTQAKSYLLKHALVF